MLIYYNQPIKDKLTLMLKCNYINKPTIILVNICKIIIHLCQIKSVSQSGN